MYSGEGFTLHNPGDNLHVPVYVSDDNPGGV